MLITLADGIKLFFKEGITPTAVDRPVYAIAPILAMFPGFLAFCVIPFGTQVTLFDREIGSSSPTSTSASCGSWR